MAKNQVTSTSTSSNINSIPTAAEMKRFDDSYSKLQTLFQWENDAETDLLKACEKEMLRDTELALIKQRDCEGHSHPLRCSQPRLKPLYVSSIIGQRTTMPTSSHTAGNVRDMRSRDLR
jgi:hypothetical protein